MKFKIVFLPDAIKDIEKIIKSGNKPLIKKLKKLLEELEEHPETGTGKPERLKNNLSGFWSRRINQEHRLVYSIDGDKVIVTVVSAFSHY
ncbi:Txe/YoeB family addiction module toxin [Algoriphagus boritolerans]|uniref:Putative mRNA interferase YoeB n=1 Tax=Algoriphagus boritolerans DSM 17298 = JCM 18970 TaxID=1120964 RepID=A0A1H5X422_9BACT|nr:Txe/YoeB family addiction module toxin [Algoriphagus boritolerans]SEG06117.1 toxin YoeB [Algoriphagus boritolerans DSM 17298 = JCM 18970]